MDTILTFFVQKNDQNDDVIVVQKQPSSIFKVTYSPNDISGKYIFFMTRDKLLDYVSTLLDTLYEDVHPFSYIQVMTTIAPSVIYNIADIPDVRGNIMDMVSFTLSARPERQPKLSE